MDKQLIYNCIETPDGTRLHSHSVHDYKSHVDKNGEVYVTDGGSYYLHRSLNKEPPKILDVYSDAPHKELREVFYWGTYGKEGKDEYNIVELKLLSDQHIKAIIKTQTHLPEWRLDIFNRELLYREEEGIFIEDTSYPLHGSIQ